MASFSSSPYYHSLTKKFTGLFGALFSNITLVRYSESGQEISRIKVPILYGDRERYLHRLVDPDYNRSVGIDLPRMAFTFMGREYDPTRRLNPLLRTTQASDATTVDAGYTGAPYIIRYQLSILSRNEDDNEQILEQILPLFSPDYTISALPLPELGFVKDIPVILESVDTQYVYNDDYESIRSIVSTLDFTMRVYYYGPTEPVKIIRKVFANIFLDPILKTGAVLRVNVRDGVGDFKPGDTAFQGNSLQFSTAAGIVTDWSANNQILYLGAVQGTFQQNSVIHAQSTQAHWTLDSFIDTPQQLVEIEVDPIPPTANIGDDYGYNIQITEYGDTILGG